MRSDPDISHFNAFKNTCIVPLKGFDNASGSHIRHQHTLRAHGDSGWRRRPVRSAVCLCRMRSPHLAGRADVAASGGLRGKKKKKKDRNICTVPTGWKGKSACLSHTIPLRDKLSHWVVFTWNFFFFFLSQTKALSSFPPWQLNSRPLLQCHESSW